MRTILPEITQAGSPRYYTASEASRLLVLPVGKILLAIRALNLPIARAGCAKSAALLLSPQDIQKIENFIQKSE